jgi:hypothetical protein
MILILAIIFLLGQILTTISLIKPIEEIREIRLQKAIDTNSKFKAKYMSWVLLFVIIFNAYFITCFYLFSKYINNIAFTIATIILIIINLFECLIALTNVNKLDNTIKIRCSEKAIIKDRIINFICIVYIAIVLIKIFL